MKCTIPGSNVKIFGRAIHSLAKIGDEIYFEPLVDGLSIRTVNSSRSAFSCFLFNSSFFTSYENVVVTDSTSDDAVLRCKIKAKTCVSIFRSMSSLEKSVEKCKIKLDTSECRLVIQLCCRHGIVKTHNLAFIECESLQAVFAKDSMPNIIQTNSKLYGDTVANFQISQEEVSLIVDNEKVLFKNYVQEEKDPQKIIHTSLCLDPEEFEIYTVNHPSEVTFCLKEFRAVLAFCEPLHLSLSAHFESGGKPIIFSVSTDSSFEANYVLATLSESSSEPSQTNTSQTINNSTRYQSQSSAKLNSTNVTKSISSESGLKNTIPTRPNSEMSNVDMKIINGDKHCQSLNPTKQHSHKSDSIKRTSDEMRLDSDITNSKNAKFGHSNYTAKTQCPSINSSANNVSSINTTSVNKLNKNGASLFGNSSDSDEEEDGIPCTPPPKKSRSLFLGWSQSTTEGSQTTQKRIILAEDTDEED